MHPQLGARDKNIVCREFIQALETCHLSGWARLTGRCNGQKDALNSCLRKERVARAQRNGVKAKEANEKTKKALEEWHADD